MTSPGTYESPLHSNWQEFRESAPDMTLTGRQGFAIYLNGSLVGWTLTQELAKAFYGPDIKVVRVSDGAVINYLSSEKYRK